MKVLIATEEIQLTPDVNDLVQKKLNEKLDKYVNGIPEDVKEARVQLIRDSRWGFRVTFDLSLPGKKHIHAEEKHKELPAAITLVSEEAEKQLRKIKEKADPTK